MLNELDWWIASQWEYIPTKHKYIIEQNGRNNKGHKYNALRKTKLKECYGIRYADDFKILCRNKKDASKIYKATTQWLKERLQLEISEEKSKITYLKNCYSEFLGIKLKVHKKGKKANGKVKYVIKSKITDKAKNKIIKEIKQYNENIKKSNTKEKIYQEINKYNAYVIGVHNYYEMATHVYEDFKEIAYKVIPNTKHKIGQIISEKDGKIIPKYVPKRYNKSRQLKFIGSIPLIPIGYICHKHPMIKKKTTNKYTKIGREEIHKELECINPYKLNYLMKNYIPNKSVEYNDNRLSLYVAQKGKCAVTKQEMSLGEMHCHHIKPKEQGGTDKYSNLVFIIKDVHKLIHAKKEKTIKYYIAKIRADKEIISKINKLREKALLPPISNQLLVI